MENVCDSRLRHLHRSLKNRFCNLMTSDQQQNSTATDIIHNLLQALNNQDWTQAHLLFHPNALIVDTFNGGHASTYDALEWVTHVEASELYLVEESRDENYVEYTISIPYSVCKVPVFTSRRKGRIFTYNGKISSLHYM